MNLKRWALGVALFAALGFGWSQILKADSTSTAATSAQDNAQPTATADTSSSPSATPGSEQASAPDSAGPSDDNAPGPDGELGPMMEHMKDKLGLSDDQAQQVQDIMKKDRENNKGLREEAMGLTKTLKGQVDAGASDSDLNTTLDSLMDLQKRMEEAHHKMESDLRGVLKPAQYAKFTLMMIRRMMAGGMMMRGGKHQGGGEGGGQPVDKGGN